MNKIFRFLIVIGLAAAMSLLLTGCPDPTIDETTDQTPPSSSIEVVNPPDGTTTLPDTIALTLEYSLTDDDYVGTNTYRVYGYFRGPTSIAQAYQQTLTDQSSDGMDVSFSVPSALLDNMEVPYRLYFALYDETEAIPMQLATSSDMIYQEP